MRRRSHPVSLWLTDKEYEHLQKQALIAGRKIDPFIRDLIKGVSLKEHPPETWAELVRQLSAIGNNINQIARIANTAGTVDAGGINAIIEMQSDIWRKVKDL